MVPAVIDLHSHVLPGLDDGARDLSEAVEICNAAVADGVEILAATPHVRHDYPTTPDQIEAGLDELRHAVGAAIRLVPGAELAVSELQRPESELRRYALAGNPSYLLVETPYAGWPIDLTERLVRLRRSGITPVLAHPERNDMVQARPELLVTAVESGALVQLTASSLDGRLGARARECARLLLDRSLAHLLASDAHAPSVRAAGLSAAARAVGDRALSRWLTVDVPRAIVEGAPLPPRPAPRSLLRRLARRTVMDD
jgi:protein-tyrosine phosphatase